MRRTQREENPFPFSDSNKRYYTYDYYLRHTFGGKCAKIPLDGGFTCPNIDGTCGTGGCIYCSGNGSGDFTAPAILPIREQYRVIRERITRKWPCEKFIAYFQPHTNTYAPLKRLRALYEEALALPQVVGLNIATRADAVPDEVIDYLAALSERTVLTLELGLQTIHDETAYKINRGHTYAVFLDAYQRIRERAPKVRIGIHLIFGLIGENDEMMVKTVQKVAGLAPDEVKFHLLYVLKGTKMAEILASGAYTPMREEDYVNLMVRAIQMMPPETVIGRLTGDGAEKALIAPLWSRKKLCILNEIDKKIYNENGWQGKMLSVEPLDESKSM